MKHHTSGLARRAFGALATALMVTTPAQAGPPLICHPIAIGHAKSLPWSDLQGKAGDASYDFKNLVLDTLAILNSNTTVLVRMETLRRATLYARRDPQIAKELLTRLYARVTSAEAAGRQDALAWFDVGYLTECYRQWIGINLPHMTDGIRLDPNPAAGLDGYAWVNKAISLRGGEPEMEFAAALIALGRPQQDYREHVLKAIAGAKEDPLLAQNLANHAFSEAFATVATAAKK